VAVEYGIENCYDDTLHRIHRGHDFACTEHAIRATATRGIHVGGHLILGLPGESREQMLAEADILSGLPLSTLKLHQLQLLRGSELERLWREDPSAVPPPFTVEEYVMLVADFLRRLRPDIAIERLAAEVPPRYMANPARSWRRDDGSHVRPDNIARLVAQRLSSRD
jgi:radical SAM superfamily enzyme